MKGSTKKRALHYMRAQWLTLCGLRLDEGCDAPPFTADIATFRQAKARCEACALGL